jgi:uncharacterized membrane protein YphA (DoxX/SURF4 family)
MNKSLIVDIIAAALIFLFVYTSVSKLNEIYQFQAALKQHPLLADRSVFFSWAIPLTELFISLLLFIPRTRRLGILGSFVIMLIFTLYIGYMIAFIPHLPCSCGGVLKHMSWTQHLFFNIGFTLVALAGIFLSRKNDTSGTQHNSYYTLA